MTQIDCIGISKRFNGDILFRDFTYKFKNTNKYAIIGENSSGKSTLLKIIGGVLSATKGEINYSSDINQSNQISYSSPEMNLLNEYSIQELFDFHFQFKKPKISIKESSRLLLHLFPDNDEIDDGSASAKVNLES